MLLMLPLSNVLENLYTRSESGFLHRPNPCSVNVVCGNGQPVRNIAIAVGPREQVVTRHFLMDVGARRLSVHPSTHGRGRVLIAFGNQ